MSDTDRYAMPVPSDEEAELARVAVEARIRKIMGDTDPLQGVYERNV